MNITKWAIAFKDSLGEQALVTKNFDVVGLEAMPLYNSTENARKVLVNLNNRLPERFEHYTTINIEVMNDPQCIKDRWTKTVNDIIAMNENGFEIIPITIST